MYRIVLDRTRAFSDKYPLTYLPFPQDREPIASSEDLMASLKRQIEEKTKGHKCALALSGGIDSAILLKLMPEGTVAYTFKCVVPGMQVTDESITAKKYIEYARPDMTHKIVEITWEDMEHYAPELMKRKGAPIHSIEVQIHKAALQAKADGCDLFVFGETADCIYGGHSQLLSQDWTIGSFIDRWSFVLPYHVLRHPVMDLDVYYEYAKEDGMMDVPRFLTMFESEASWNSYMNACGLADMDFFSPYAQTIMCEPLDLERVRHGENKYLVREVFQSLYPDFTVPPKTPMPRPVNEWLKDWKGPKREEFLPGCVRDLTGDQKWLCWALEKFLDIIDEQ